MMQPVSAGVLMRGMPRWGILAIAGILFVVAFAASPPEFFQPSPLGPVDTANLEKEFDVDRAAAMARYGAKPVLVRGEITSVHSDRVTLKTIYLLDVQAYFKGSTMDAAPGPAMLRCDHVKFQDYFGTTKPLLEGCRLMSDA